MERIRKLISGMMDVFKRIFDYIREHPNVIIIGIIMFVFFRYMFWNFIYMIYISFIAPIMRKSKFENFIVGDSTRANKKETPWGEWTDWEGPRDMSGERCGTARRYRSRACLRQPCINRDGKQIDLEVDVKKMKPCDLQIGP